VGDGRENQALLIKRETLLVTANGSLIALECSRALANTRSYLRF